MRDINIPAVGEARCKFYVRVPGSGGGWHYYPINVKGPTADGRLTTEHPPQHGDLIHLWGEDDVLTRGTFVVIGRDWLHPAYGSTNWPIGEPRPLEPPMLDLLVEPSEEGLFVDEVVDDG